MASAFWVVGIGGCGRGVCNHIKYDLEQEYGSLANAQTQILVIDGPEKDDVYALPGGFEIDTGKNSPEFYRTTVNPSSVIKNIASGNTGKNEAYVAEWLSKTAASLIPSDSTDPTTGFGGHRSPGHAFFYLDVGSLKTRLQKEYNNIRQLLGTSPTSSNQVIIVVVGSLSGGTGAGLLFDVMHLLRDAALQNQDMIVNFLPLPNTYHSLPTSPGELKAHNAQNFAGILNLMRFMTTNDAFPTIIKYSDQVSIHNARISDIPFIIDGNVSNAKLNDVPPRLGVVPVIADFLLTIIKDNIKTSAIQPQITNWAQKMIGVAEYPEKYAGFGATSIRYNHKELLQTFSYRFTFALYDLILNPMGAELDKGKLIAKSILNQISFTQMVEDPMSTSLEPPAPPSFGPEFRTLGSRIRTGKPGEQPFPYPAKSYVEQIDFGHSAMRFGGLREKVNVKNDAQKAVERYKQQLINWFENQRERIVKIFAAGLENEIMNVFYMKQNEKMIPRSLQDSPSSIVIARDLLKYLLEKLEAYQLHVGNEYQRNLYPNGTEKNSIIADNLQKLNNAETQMLKNSTSATQKKYLEEMQRHFNLEVWNLLLQGTQAITVDLIKRVNGLWNLIGEGADGWITILTKYRTLMDGKYQGDLERRRGFDQLRLRRYVPTTGGNAEDSLFEDIAVPVLETFRSQTFWMFTVDPNITGKYELVINTPAVSSYDNQQSINDLRDVITGDKLKDLHYYNPFNHCHYAIENMKGFLGNKTVWDILEIECMEDWCKNQDISADKRNVDDYVSQLAEEFVTRSDVSLDYKPSQNIVNQDHAICCRPGDKKSVGGKFLQALENKGCKFYSHADLSKEIRRVNLSFRIPIRQWSYYDQAQADYVEYVSGSVQRMLIDIYPNEQNAARIRKYIETKVNNSFTEVIETSVTSLLYNYEIFQKAALCYVMNLIPIIAGATTVSPKKYCLNFSTGAIDLCEEWDIYSLMNCINQPDRLVGSQWRPNKDIQDMVLSFWDSFEQGYKTRKDLPALGNDLKISVQNLQLPSPPAGQFDTIDPLGKKHLALAIRAVVEEYAELLK